MHLVWAGVILGVAAVWGVPIVSFILAAVLPEQAKSYLPTTTVPGVDTSSVVHALVYGVLLASVLALLRAAGLRGAGRV